MTPGYVQFQSDNRNLKMAMTHISVFYNEKRSYDCPECKAPMDRANRHGWYWYCDPCKKHFPLYKLEKPKPLEPEIKQPGWAKGLVTKLKESLHG